jgi:TetR/AcrR family transcriptional regulator, cholesterol catabolism regulator
MGGPSKTRKKRVASASSTATSGANGDGTERRSEILEIATRVFARKGIANTTMRDIADEVGILHGSLYYHFGSKEQLLDEILRPVMTDLVDQYLGILDQVPDPVEAVKRLIELEIRLMVGTHRDVTSIVENDYLYLRDSEAFGWVEGVKSRTWEIWSTALRRCVVQGKFDAGVDLNVAYHAITGSIVRTVRWYEPDGPMSLDDLIASQLGILVDGLRTRPGRKRKVTPETADHKGTVLPSK